MCPRSRKKRDRKWRSLARWNSKEWCHVKRSEFDLRFEKSVYLPSALLQDMHGQLSWEGIYTVVHFFMAVSSGSERFVINYRGGALFFYRLPFREWLVKIREGPCSFPVSFVPRFPIFSLCFRFFSCDRISISPLPRSLSFMLLATGAVFKCRYEFFFSILHDVRKK